MTPPLSIAAVRRKLQALPGFQALPECPACKRQVEPRDFAPSGHCQDCQALEDLDGQIQELWAASRERPADQALEDALWLAEVTRQELWAKVHPEVFAPEASDAREDAIPVCAHLWAHVPAYQKYGAGNREYLLTDYNPATGSWRLQLVELIPFAAEAPDA